MEQELDSQKDTKVHGSNRCFGCGPANPGGLLLEFAITADKSVNSTAIIAETFAGHPGLLHGGIISTLLDEAMSKAVRARGFTAMTRHMEVDFLRPVPTQKPLRIEGRVTHNEGRKHWTEARIHDAGGNLLAQGKGLFVEVTRGASGIVRRAD